jgi:murein DD-endopeptidase MepM/ murein hydrolase activator NlpD
MFAALSMLFARLAFVAALGSPPCLLPPVSGSIVDPFRPPGCPYCPGNRGIEYSTQPGAAVVASSAGTVTFAGPVAGVRYVVVEHIGGYRTTYGRLAAALVVAGVAVRSGQRLGTAGPVTFFGLRLGETYLDPAPHLATVLPQPRLVPLDGTARRMAPTPRLTC